MLKLAAYRSGVRVFANAIHLPGPATVVKDLSAARIRKIFGPRAEITKRADEVWVRRDSDKSYVLLGSHCLRKLKAP